VIDHLLNLAIPLAIAVFLARVPALAQGKASAPPTDDELLRSPPYDRMTLVDGTVLIIDPISPRPLPPYDPSKKRDMVRDRGEIPEEGNIIVGVPTKIEAPKIGKDPDPNAIAEDEVKLHLLGGSAQEVLDFKVKRTNIKKIEYFEDMLLLESDRHVVAHDYARAFECCLRVQIRNPGWRGLDERVNNVLFAEGKSALQSGDGERGMRMMRELLARKRNYPGLLDQVADAYGKRIERAMKIGLYARGRQILHELAELAAEHPRVRDLRDSFLDKANQRVRDSRNLRGPERLDALAEALRIWPKLDAIEPVYEDAFMADPTLEVAVTDVAFPLGPWIRSPADARLSRMLYWPVLAVDDDNARKGKRADQIADSIESSDLGRRIVIKIRPGFLWSDGSRPVSAIDVGRELIDRTDPHSNRYAARWAEQLDRVDVTDETRLEIRLHHAPLKAGACLLGPVGPAHAGVDGRVSSSTQDRPLVTDGPFRCVSAAANLVELRLREDSGNSGAPAPVNDAANEPASALPAANVASDKPAENPLRNEAAARATHAVPGGKIITGKPAENPVSDSAAGTAAIPGRKRKSAKIKRIREVYLKKGESAVAALRRGEVSLIEHVPPGQVMSLAQDPEIKVGRYNKPVIHLIALDGRNPALRSRSLRRGLSYAIDRKGLLEDYMLRRPPLELDSVADGPFPKGSFADAPGVKPLDVQPWLAKMLVAAARKELNNMPIKLVFEYPEIPEVAAVVPRIAEAFRQSGVQIETVGVSPSRLEVELRGGRPFQLAYRVLNVDDPVLDAGVLLCPGYDAPAQADALASACSKEILQLLLQLERASDWATVRSLVVQIDREARDELPVVPLWQLADHYAWRDRLTGPGQTADRLYQGIETWDIAPWIARDSWDNE
jgi:ABC-type transport system substrate-binding protein